MGQPYSATYLKTIHVVAAFVARLGDVIPQELVAMIVHRILVVGVYGVIIGAIGWGTFTVGKKYIQFFKEKQADEISVFVGLITLAIVVFASNQINPIYQSCWLDCNIDWWDVGNELELVDR